MDEKGGLRYVCRECNKYYGRFLNDGEFPHREWSEEDKQILIENYADYMGKELQIKFFPTRSIRSIETEASILGVAYKSDETKERKNKYQSEIISQLFTGRTWKEESKRKLSEALKEHYKTHPGNNLGKTFSEEHRKHLSEAKSALGKWKGDKNPRHKNPLNGENNGRWKGGIINTYAELRSDTKEWQSDSMQFCSYKCVISGGEFDNVHHVLPFKDIVNTVFIKTGLQVKQSVADYTNEEFELLRNELKSLHHEYGFEACIQYDVHKLFHDNYGYVNCSPSDFIDFYNRIKNHEFDEWFNCHNLKININEDYFDYIKDIFND